MTEQEVQDYYNNLPEETQKFITKVMLSTIDVCNSMLDGKDAIIFFEDVAYKCMRNDILFHMLNEEWFDALGDLTWKKKGEKTSWDGKFPIKHNKDEE